MMKTKNKKILTRLSAVLATLLLVGVMALPCFADAVTEPTQYVLTEVAFADYSELFTYVSTNFHLISHVIIDNGDTAMLFRPSLRVNDDPLDVFLFVDPIIIGDTNNAINSTSSFMLSSGGILLTLLQGSVNNDLLVQNRQFSADDIGEMAVVVYAFEPAELTSIPVDPDAPTRTGLYGELYHIIRDAIYGENALLDSTQEFTLTQIATWMTYIVILLPFVVIGIILFKIFVR